MKIAHLTTVDLSLRYLLLRQLEEAQTLGESIGISAPGEFVSELEERGIRHIALPSSTRNMSLLADLRAMRELWKILKEERPDLLHTHNPKPGLYGRVLGRLAGVPIVVNTVHGLYAAPDSPWPRRALVYLLEAIASRFSDAELVQNPEDLELMRRLAIVPRARLRYLGNGVDLVRFNPARAGATREETRAKLGLKDGDIAVGMVGRLVVEKGVPELIEAARRLGSEARVFVVGPRDLDKEDALPDTLLSQGAASGIAFLGMRSDVDALYGAFDIFVLPSHREGFPRAAMEAAASGLPLVLTDIRGCREVVENGRNGFLIPVGDVDSLANAIQTLIRDAELRRSMGTASASRSESDFDERKVVEIVMNTYREIATGKGMAWLTREPSRDAILRPATLGDAKAIARLHATLITTGFISSLGFGFLHVLYRSLIESDRGLVSVAESDGVVIGFIAGTDDTGEFYKEFLRHEVVAATWHLLPAFVRPRVWRSVWETMRYGRSGAAAGAELLAMAVAPGARGIGLGSRLVERLLVSAVERGKRKMRVVVGADNHAAISLYSRKGFSETRRIELHRGVPSLEMTWQS